MAITDPKKSNVERLKELKQLEEAGILTKEEVTAEKQLILGSGQASEVTAKSEATTKSSASEEIQPERKKQVPPPRWIWLIVLAIAILIGYLTLSPRGCSSEAVPYVDTLSVDHSEPEFSEEDSRWNEQELRSFSKFTSNDTEYEIMFDVDFIIISKKNNETDFCFWYPAIYLDEIGEIKLAGANKMGRESKDKDRFSNMNLRIKKRGSSWVINSTKGNTGIEGVYVGKY